MLAALLPLFDENMSVSAYSLFAQKDNYFVEPKFLSTGVLDGACVIKELEIIDKMGMKTLAENKEIFIPVDGVSVFSDFASQCNAAHKRIVIFMDNSVKPTQSYVEQLKSLKEQGYKLAIKKLSVIDFEPYKPILNLVDYIFLNYKKIDINKAKIYFSNVYPDIKLIAGNVDAVEDFEKLKNEGGYSLFEGDFYRVPVTKGDNEVAPLKLNYLELLNIVQDPDYDLTKAADIIGRDTALVIELLKLVNKLSRNSEIATIRHAAAMLGQKELRKWIMTAVTKLLCHDKPNEITRLSLIRAKFAENLGKVFYMGVMAPELFILGLFSVLDIILNMPMEKALEKVMVSTLIRQALVEDKGEFAPVIDLIRNYEKADWSEISRVVVLNDFEMDHIYNAYCDALTWYRDIFFDE